MRRGRRRRSATWIVVTSAALLASCTTTEAEAPADGIDDTVPQSTATSSSTTAPATSTTMVVESLTTTTAAPTTTSTLPPDPLQGLTLEMVAADLHQPTAIAAPPGDDRLFVTERRGRVRVIGPNGLREEPFIDLEDRVGWEGIEQGLLGLVFHPDFVDNGRFFVYYTDLEGRRTLSELIAEGDLAGADGASERILFGIPQPAGSVDTRHYGGHLAFGPDGHLYVSQGDGADARGQGQDPDTLYAAILRLDVESGDPYATPEDNPFVDGGGAPEVWAFGLRNPWRFTIDEVDNLMYVADVGQEQWEEVDVLSLEGGGYNLGWPSMEGFHCFLEPGCDPDDYVLPVLEYGHDEGCSITGGHVYRGSAIPELQGHYFYADWCRQWVRSFRHEDGEVTAEEDWAEDLSEAGQVNTFGVNATGEMYLANFAGEVHKIVPVR